MQPHPITFPARHAVEVWRPARRERALRAVGPAGPVLATETVSIPRVLPFEPEDTPAHADVVAVLSCGHPWRGGDPGALAIECGECWRVRVSLPALRARLEAVHGSAGFQVDEDGSVAVWWGADRRSFLTHHAPGHPYAPPRLDWRPWTAASLAEAVLRAAGVVEVMAGEAEAAR